MKAISEKIIFKAKRRQEIELLRIISIFGVIWFHASVIGKEWAYSGLIVFLIVSMYFSYSSDGGITSQIYRSKRILVPWLFWFCLYGLINLFLGKPFVEIDKGLLSGVLAGTTIHLWYIPFIVVISFFISMLKHILPHVFIRYLFFILIILNVITVDYWRGWSLNLGYPIAQYLQAINGVFIGVFLASSVSYSKRFLFVLLSIIVLFYYFFAIDIPGVGVPYIVGVLISSLFLLPNWDWRFNINISYFSECTFGIYLCHILWLMFCRKFFSGHGINLPVVVFFLSLATVLAIKKFLPDKSIFIV